MPRCRTGGKNTILAKAGKKRCPAPKIKHTPKNFFPHKGATQEKAKQTKHQKNRAGVKIAPFSPQPQRPRGDYQREKKTPTFFPAKRLGFFNAPMPGPGGIEHKIWCAPRRRGEKRGGQPKPKKSRQTKAVSSGGIPPPVAANPKKGRRNGKKKPGPISPGPTRAVPDHFLPQRPPDSQKVSC